MNFLNNVKKEDMLDEEYKKLVEDICEPRSCVYTEDNKFYRWSENDKIYWVVSNIIGDFRFSFDKKTIYNFFGGDYPNKLTKEEKEIFDKENPYLADFYK